MPAPLIAWGAVALGGVVVGVIASRGVKGTAEAAEGVISETGEAAEEVIAATGREGGRLLAMATVGIVIWAVTRE